LREGAKPERLRPQKHLEGEKPEMRERNQRDEDLRDQSHDIVLAIFSGANPMLIVTGSLVARQDSFEELRAQALEHVRRSRGEPGCLSHAVHIDCENPLRLVFVEKWESREALLAHFAVPESRGFVKSARTLAVEASPIGIFEAEPVQQL
jgi:quinol monooxygenase YgiN